MKHVQTYNEFIGESGQDHRPESVKHREKVFKLHTKSEEAVTKARELESNGDLVKSKIQQLTAESLKLKAKATEIDWRIKQLKNKI